MSAPAPGPTLAARLGGRLGQVAAGGRGPSTYLPALLVLAALPGAVALGAAGLTLDLRHRDALRREAAAVRLGALAQARQEAARRAALAPYLEAPTLTAALSEIAAALPADARLHASARGADGVWRIEVDCADPDVLRQALRERAPERGWRSVAQSVATGGALRVTLEASR